MLRVPGLFGTHAALKLRAQELMRQRAEAFRRGVVGEQLPSSGAADVDTRIPDGVLTPLRVGGLLTHVDASSREGNVAMDFNVQ